MNNTNANDKRNRYATSKIGMYKKASLCQITHIAPTHTHHGTHSAHSFLAIPNQVENRKDRMQE